MSGESVWPSLDLCPAEYTHCVRSIFGDYWWARPTLDGYVGVPCSARSRSRGVERRITTANITASITRKSPREVHPGMYSAVWLNPTGMGWVKQPKGPVETMRAPYDEMLARVKTIAEMYPDTTYTVVKVCAEVRTPPKPTLEVKEY